MSQTPLNEVVHMLSAEMLGKPTQFLPPFRVSSGRRSRAQSVYQNRNTSRHQLG